MPLRVVAGPGAQGRPFKLVKSTQTGKTAAETARTTVSKERSGDEYIALGGIGEKPAKSSERYLDTVVRAVSASVLPVWVDFTSLKGLPCAPGPATTRRGMLVTNNNNNNKFYS